MATTLSQIGQLLQSAGYNFHLDDERGLLFIGFGTQVYQDRQSEFRTSMAMSLGDNGRMLTVAARFCYQAGNAAHHHAVLEACSIANSRFRLGRFVLDRSDGEVALIVDHAAMDSAITTSQMETIIGLFPSVLDLVDPMFRTAIATGEVTEPTDPSDMAKEFAEFMRQRRQIATAAPAGLGLEE